MRVWQVRAVLWLLDFIGACDLDHPTTPPPLPLLLAARDRIIQHNAAASVIRTAASNNEAAVQSPHLPTYNNIWCRDNSSSYVPAHFIGSYDVYRHVICLSATTSVKCWTLSF